MSHNFSAAFVAFAVASLPSANLADEQSITIKGDVKVFDGDTLEIGPMLVRLHGIDAPEKGQKTETQTT